MDLSPESRSLLHYYPNCLLQSDDRGNGHRAPLHEVRFTDHLVDQVGIGSINHQYRICAGMLAQLPWIVMPKAFAVSPAVTNPPMAISLISAFAEGYVSGPWVANTI